MQEIYNTSNFMYFTGITIAVMTFLTIGIWHPIVIKTEYYWGTRPWILYLIVGICCCAGALFTENVYLSSFLGVSVPHLSGLSANSLSRRSA